MQNTILRYGAAAAMALALGLGGCVHITNTYTGIPPGGEAAGATRTVADKGSAAGDCGCRGGAPGYYSQGYAPAPYQQSPYGGYYSPTYNYYPPQIYSDYPYNYYPAPYYYPPQVYAPYGGYYGERPQGGGGEQRVGGEVVGSAPPRGTESHERRPVEPATHRGQPVADGPGPVLAPRTDGGRGVPSTDRGPRVNDGGPVVEVTPAPSHERRPAVTGPNAYGGINPSAGTEPVARPRMPHVNGSPAAPRGDMDTRTSSDIPVVEPRGAMGGSGERTSPQSPGSSEVRRPAEDPASGASAGSHARRETAPAPVDLPASHTSREVRRAEAPVDAAPTATPTATPATSSEAPVVTPAAESQVKRETTSGSAPASSSSSRMRRGESSTDRVNPEGASSSESRERKVESPSEAPPVSVVSRPENASASGTVAGTAARSSSVSSPSVGAP